MMLNNFSNSYVEIWKLPCFDVQIPEACLNTWKQRYDEYRPEMREALEAGGKLKNDSANEVNKKYKQVIPNLIVNL